MSIARLRLVLSGGIVSALATGALGGPVGPSGYLSFSDSPYANLGLQNFHLETFEDGLPTEPGLDLSIQGVRPPSAITDSVDGDDGIIDGDGRGGFSYHSRYGIDMDINFDRDELLGWPTHVGLAITDVGWDPVGPSNPPVAVGLVRLTAIAANGTTTLGFIEVPFGDGSVLGGTSEDIFLGWTDVGGISRIRINVENRTNRDFEVDHIQYNPTPGTALVLLAGGVSASRRRRP